MRDREIDEMLRRAAGAQPEVDPALLDRVSASIQPSLGPVRPLPPRWVLVSGLFLISEAVALTGAFTLGLYGIGKLSAPEIALIFPVLGIFTWLAAMGSASETAPGSRHLVAPAFLLAIGSLSLAAIFAVLFHDYRLERFVSQGLACLAAGLLHALPAALAGWLVLRRGFAVNPVAAGLAAGTLASLAGVTMLELHCPNLKAAHVMLWHTGVIPVSALAGALVGWARHARRTTVRRRT